MANSLLDFVMSVVRDPGVAARYAQNPAQAIADAHLTGVTSADVDNLIPVVSESLTVNAPAFGADASSGAPDNTWSDGNIWASGAATAAFDAFADHLLLDGFAYPAVPSDSLVDSGSVPVADTAAELPGIEPVFAEPIVDAVADPVESALTDPVIDAVTPHVDAGFDGHPAPGHDFFG